MALTPDQVFVQVRGHIDSLKHLSAKEREGYVTSHYAENFNKILRLAKQSLPSVDANRWPAEIKSAGSTQGPAHTDAKYVDIFGYYNEILEIIRDETDSGPPTMSMG